MDVYISLCANLLKFGCVSYIAKTWLQASGYHTYLLSMYDILMLAISRVSFSVFKKIKSRHKGTKDDRVFEISIDVLYQDGCTVGAKKSTWKINLRHVSSNVKCVIWHAKNATKITQKCVKNLGKMRQKSLPNKCVKYHPPKIVCQNPPASKFTASKITKNIDASKFCASIDMPKMSCVKNDPVSKFQKSKFPLHSSVGQPFRASQDL